MKPQQLINLIDLTSLPANLADTSVESLAVQANTAFGPVAAVCLYPEWVAAIKKQLLDIPVATVCNFPGGEQPLDQTLSQIKDCIALGADEIDVVLPYAKLLQGNQPYCFDFIKQCKEACGDVTLKVIIESGALLTPDYINQACELVIAAGADFIKTSTGKIEKGASLEAVATIVESIKRNPQAKVGVKISGGVRDYNTANQYMDLIEQQMGAEWINSNTVRIGASSLLTDVLALCSE